MTSNGGLTRRVMAVSSLQHCSLGFQGYGRQSLSNSVPNPMCSKRLGGIAKRNQCLLRFLRKLKLSCSTCSIEWKQNSLISNQEAKSNCAHLSAHSTVLSDADAERCQKDPRKQIVCMVARPSKPGRGDYEFPLNCDFEVCVFYSRRDTPPVIVVKQCP